MSTYATNPAPKTVRLERLLPGPVERVWAFLVEPEKRARWFAGGVLEPRVGGARELVFKHDNITDEPPPERFKGAVAGFTSVAKMTRWEPPRALAYTWSGDGAESEVTWELEPRGDDVLFIITHRQLPTRAEMVDVSGGWTAHVDILEALLRGTKAKGFWSNIERLEKHYEETYPPDAAGRGEVMAEPIRISVSRDFAYPAERVFDAFLDPAIARRFLFATETGEMVRAETDPRVGGVFTFVDRRAGEDVLHAGEYLEIDRPRRLVFTFGVPKYSPDFDRVEVEITPNGAGCSLTLTEFMAPENAEWAERSKGGWAMILGNLEKALG